ncbi:MAG TPA: hypothetical protein VK176_00685, partial [Phycisphaerales bacterium]|nr:hypothetical protein [Phycisphaerales bacterium]
QTAWTPEELDRLEAAISQADVIVILMGEDAVSSLRVESLLCLGRITDAESFTTSAEPWLSALGRSVDKPFAHAILEELRRRFEGRLTDAQSQRLEGLASRVTRPEAQGTSQVPPVR